MNDELILEEKLQIFTRGQIVTLLVALILVYSAFLAFADIDFDDTFWDLVRVLFFVGSVFTIPGVFLASWAKTFTSIRVFKDRVEVVNRLIVNNTRRIEASKIESSDFSQSVLGRSAYGTVIIRGSGMVALTVTPVRNPENLAEAVRAISSKSAAKAEQFSPQSSDATGSLAELISMKNQGHLTEEEFAGAKKKLLG